MNQETQNLLAVSAVRRLYYLRHHHRDGAFARENLKFWIKVAKKTKS